MNILTKLVKEIVRNELLISEYRKIPTGMFAISEIRKDLINAYEAVDSGDIESIIDCLEALKTHE